MGFVKNYFFKQSLYSLEKFIYDHAEAVVALSPMIKASIEKKIPGRPVHLIPNMADTNFYKPEVKNEALLRKFGLTDKFVVSYIGAIGLANGLDFYIEGVDRDTQAHYFDAQLALAREFDLPLVVHARRAVDAVMAAIKRVGKLRGVVHSYAGSEEQARQLADLGFLVGIGGPVTYARANRVRRVAASVPLDTLLLETDAPDQPDCDHRGQRNEPARMLRVLEVVAGLRGEDPDVIARATSRNAERLFGLPPVASA